MITDPEALLLGFGPAVLVGLAAVVFVESGLLFPFLPGDSLLFTAGLLASSGVLHEPVWAVVLTAFIAAAAGDQAGYWLGHRFGRRLFKPDARVLKTRHLDQAEAFFTRYGGPALVLGRFVPIVRTYVPLAAGTSLYRYRTFLVWNLTGAATWTVTVSVLGVVLGRIEFVRTHIDVLALLVVAVSVLPVVIAAVRRLRRDRRSHDARV